MRRLLLLSFAAGAGAMAHAQELIWAQNPSNGHWYGTSYAEMTWFDAEAAAVAQGGHLASFDSAAELAWVPAAFAAHAGSSYWIGLNDLASEGSFVWTSGDPVTITDWAPGEPDDHFGIEDAVEMRPFDTWRWHDAHALDFAGRRPLAETNDVPRFGWTLPQTYAVGEYPTHSFAAHIDGDSVVDLAVLNGITETITLLSGTGTGEFVPLATTAATTWPRSFTFGDFNQDQITDIAIGGSSFYVVRYGLGSGVFVNGPSAALGGAPFAIAAADLNGDARDDLVFGLADAGSIKVVLAHASGGFSAPVAYPFTGWAAAVTTADLDADGDLDLVVPSENADVVRVYANAGDGTFTIATTFPTGSRPGRAVVADFDGDTRLDLAVPCSTLGKLHIYHGLGNGLFDGGYVVQSSLGARWAVSLDIDGDGLVDVAVASYGKAVALHRNRGSLQTGELVAGGTGLFSVVAADFDGDGRDDLAAADNVADAVVVLRKLSRDCNGNGRDDPRDIELGASTDVNGNGEPDECESAGDPYCFGDGSGAPCPCDPGQSGDPGHGCRNSSGTSGLLAANGNASVSLDSVTLHASGLPTSTLGLFFQGDQATNGGLGAPFGDGLRCASQSVVRLVVRAATNGSMSFGHGVAGDPSVSSAGLVPASGATRHYQLWYRDAAAFCTSATWNLTNGVRIAWIP